MTASGTAWRQAGDRLSGRTSPRFTLMLALILYLLFLYTQEWMLACAETALELCGIPAPPWLWAVRLLPTVTLSLPLGAAVYRLAILLAADQNLRAGRTDGTAGMAARLTACLYPFRSPGAYGTCLAVGLEATAWTALAILPPVLAFQLAPGVLHGALILPAVGYGLFVLWLSGLRAGYADAALSAGRLACGWRRTRGLRDTFLLRLRMLGCCLACALGVFVPLLFYAAPRCLLAGALWTAGEPEPSGKTYTESNIPIDERTSRAAGNTGTES